VVLFDEKVHELIADHVQTPDDFYTALHKFVHSVIRYPNYPETR